MSDDPLELPRPAAPLTWREQLAGMVDDLGLSPSRLVAGLVGLAVIGALAWWLLAPAEPPPEMRLPFAEPQAAASNAGPTATPTGPEPVAAVGDVADGALATTPTGDVVVHVAGAVAVPGVQRLDADSRVVDAIEAAGGAGADADLARLNLAAPLADGQQVYVLRAGEDPPVLPAATPGVPGGGGQVTEAAPALVDINTANAEQLETLPGVGPATATAIISHREQNGPFTSAEQLIEVRGIGDAKMSQVRDLVTVSG